MKLTDAMQFVRGNAGRTGQRPLRLHLATGFTPNHLAMFVTAHAASRHQDRFVSCTVGPYGDVVQGLAAADSHATLVALEWQDLDPRLGFRRFQAAVGETGRDVVETVTMRLGMLLDAVRREAQNRLVAIALPSLALPLAFLAPAGQASRTHVLLQSALLRFAGDCLLIPGVAIVDVDSLERASPTEGRHAVAGDLGADIPYAPSHLTALAEALVTVAMPQPPFKGVITDLDDTLWRGIVGEVGSDAVTWSLDKGAGLHGVYQALLQGIIETGGLVAVASKNTPEVAQAALARADLRLDREKLFPTEIGWGPKSEAVARILSVWNVRPADVVFIDDSPLEVAEVRSRFPEIAAIVFPTADDEALTSVLRGLHGMFGRTKVTDDDLIRADSIRRSTDSGIAEDGSLSSDDFLKSLGATLTFDFGIDADDPRPLELINKTNQFNLNGDRIDAADWKRHLRDEASFAAAVGYADKFGPLGTISVIAGTRSGDTLDVTTWVLSCRAFARRIEHATLEAIGARFDAETIRLRHVATDRNLPAQAFVREVATASGDDDGPAVIRMPDVALPTLYHERVIK